MPYAPVPLERDGGVGAPHVNLCQRQLGFRKPHGTKSCERALQRHARRLAGLHVAVDRGRKRARDLDVHATAGHAFQNLVGDDDLKQLLVVNTVDLGPKDLGQLVPELSVAIGRLVLDLSELCLDLGATLLKTLVQLRASQLAAFRLVLLS